jgi:NADPH:quinone reductase
MRNAMPYHQIKKNIINTDQISHQKINSMKTINITSIPQYMSAVFMNTKTGQLYAKQVPLPKPGKGEVLIKMAAAPVNPSDLVRLRNMNPEELANHIPGIEGSGTVVAAGKGILPRILLGKRVTCCAVHPSNGTWADYCVTKATTCFPLGKKICDEQGSMLLVNPLTVVAFFDVIRREKHRAIISTAAAGALGRMVEQLACKYGVKVINVVKNKEQEDTLRAQGSQYVLNSSEAGFPTELNSLAKDLNASLALEAIGGQNTDHLVRAVAYGGSVIIYGNLSEKPPQFDSRSLSGQNKSIHGFYLANWIKDNGIFAVVRNICCAKKLIKNDITITVQNKFPLGKIQEAVDTYVKHMSSGKVLLIPDLIKQD